MTVGRPGVRLAVRRAGGRGQPPGRDPGRRAPVIAVTLNGSRALASGAQRNGTRNSSRHYAERAKIVALHKAESTELRTPRG